MTSRSFRSLAFAGLLGILLTAGCSSPRATTGVWSVPSLSHPGVSMIFSLHPDGTASEKIGNFQGTGKWKAEGQDARIFWDSGWNGLLRRTGWNTYELLTWKKGVSLEQPPDDRQPARRLTAFSEGKNKSPERETNP